MTGDQVIALAFLVMGWTLLAGAYRQHIGNLSIAAFLGACVAVAIHSALEAWSPSQHSFLVSLAAFAGAVWLYMWLAIRRDWGRPSELEALIEKRRQRGDGQAR
jgi:hypothetical protein